MQQETSFLPPALESVRKASGDRDVGEGEEPLAGMCRTPPLMLVSLGEGTSSAHGLSSSAREFSFRFLGRFDLKTPNFFCFFLLLLAPEAVAILVSASPLPPPLPPLLLLEEEDTAEGRPLEELRAMSGAAGSVACCRRLASLEAVRAVCLYRRGLLPSALPVRVSLEEDVRARRALSLRWRVCHWLSWLALLALPRDVTLATGLALGCLMLEDVPLGVLPCPPSSRARFDSGTSELRQEGILIQGNRRKGSANWTLVF